MAAFPIEPCRSCTQPVIWAKTKTGKRMPVNAEPSEDGNIRLARINGGPYADVLSPARLAAGTQEPLRTSHFVTCPDAPAWRRKS